MTTSLQAMSYFICPVITSGQRQPSLQDVQPGLTSGDPPHPCTRTGCVWDLEEHRIAHTMCWEGSSHAIPCSSISPPGEAAEQCCSDALIKHSLGMGSHLLRSPCSTHTVCAVCAPLCSSGQVAASTPLSEMVTAALLCTAKRWE